MAVKSVLSVRLCSLLTVFFYFLFLFFLRICGVEYFLWQVPALLDAIIDVAGGNVNIHVLIAFAALASVFMGNALEGGLLLAMFSLSHQGEKSYQCLACLPLV